MAVNLSPEEMIRYQRHLTLPEIGREGQAKLKQARVLLVGAGGLGSPVALYLVAAGVGQLGIVDADRVDLSNLQRQIVHGSADAGRLKVESARARLHDLNPHVTVTTYPFRLTGGNAMELVSGYDIVVDGTDNFAARFLINDACVLQGKPYVFGAVFQFEGQVGVFDARRGACYRCLHPEPPPAGIAPSCAEAGVLGVVPGIIGTILATETIKLITGCGKPLIGRILLLDAASMRFRELVVGKEPACPVCGPAPTITRPRDAEGTITVTELKRRMDRGDALSIIDVREPYEAAIASIPEARLIPLGQVLEHRHELDPERETVVMCRGGVRSAQAIGALRAAGYAGPLLNLTGGILAWAAEVDPSLPPC